MNVRVVLSPSLLVDCKTSTGAGVEWHRPTRRIYWADRDNQSLWSCTEDGNAAKKVPLSARLCNFSFAPDGNMLAAFEDGLFWLDARNGDRRLIHAFEMASDLHEGGDVGLDRQGRFIITGARQNKDADSKTVLAFERGRFQSFADEHSSTGNIAFSPEGDLMYSAETGSQDIFVSDYNGKTATPSNRRLFVSIKAEYGCPNGLTVDAEGAVWTSCFGGGSLRRYLPNGALDQIVESPVNHVTGCTIGGIRMNRMYITSASSSPSDLCADMQPGAGGLFMLDAPVRGLPTGTYRR